MLKNAHELKVVTHQEKISGGDLNRLTMDGQNEARPSDASPVLKTTQVSSDKHYAVDVVHVVHLVLYPLSGWV